MESIRESDESLLQYTTWRQLVRIGKIREECRKSAPHLAPAAGAPGGGGESPADHGQTDESNTRTFFQVALFSSMNWRCLGCCWYASWSASVRKTTCNPTSNSRSLTGRASASHRIPALKYTTPGCPVRYLWQSSTSFCRAAGEFWFSEK